MFGLFSPKCPLPVGWKVWAERRFRDLCGLATSRDLRPENMLTPESVELPRDFDGSELAVAELFEIVCRRMGLNPEDIDLEPGTEEQMPGAGGLYFGPEEEWSRPRIQYCDDLAGDAHQLLAVLAHEAAHEVLRQRLPDVYLDDDMENCTDLLPVLFGFGVFMANATLREVSFTEGRLYYWSLSKSGYLTSEIYGYLLALLAWTQRDDRPEWRNWLRPDAREMLVASLKYLRKTDECVFDRSLDDTWPKSFSEHQLEAALDDRSPTQQMNALVEIRERPNVAAALQSQVASLLQHSQADIRLAAMEVLGVIETPTSGTFVRLLECEYDDDVRVRRLLPQFILPECPEPEFAEAALVRMLNDADTSVAASAAESLARFSDFPDGTLATATDLVVRALARNDEPLAVACLKLLSCLTDDVEDWVESRLAEDTELLMSFRYYRRLLDE